MLFFQGALGALGLLMPGIGAKAAAMWAAIFGPVGLVILAVALAATAIIVFWDEIVQAWEFAVGVMVGIIFGIVGIFQFVGKQIVAAWQATVDFLVDVIEGYVNLFKFVWGKIIGIVVAVFGFVAGIVSSVIDAIIDTIGGLIDLVGGALTTAFEFFGGVASTIGDAILTVFRFVASVIEKMIQFIRDAFELAVRVKNFVGSIGEDVTAIGFQELEKRRIALEVAGVEGAPPGEFNIPPSPIVAAATALAAPPPNVTVAGGKTEVTSNIKLELDGEVIANVVTKQLAEDGRRRSQPTAGGID